MPETAIIKNKCSVSIGELKEGYRAILEPQLILASPFRAASTGSSNNQAVQCWEGRGRDRDEDRDEKQLGRGEVSS